MPRKAKVLIEVTPAMSNMLLRLLPYGDDDPKAEFLGPMHKPTLNRVRDLIWTLQAATHPEDGPYK